VRKQPHIPEPRRLDELLRQAIFDAHPGLEQELTEHPAAFLELVGLAAEAKAQTGELLESAVQAARGAGQSWDAIGKKLGMSRQAAQQRFTRTIGDVELGEKRKLSPLTAFDEMEVLAREGTFGWHSVDFGTLYHLVERSDVQWEHLRVSAASVHRKQLEREGWSRIGSMWFPWAYYARPTDRPALSDPS
jgi:hypothetical protein